MTQPASERQRLIYIVGLGGSGTTLISLLLNQMENVLSLGEIEASLRAIRQDQIDKDSCTCGKTMQDCQFWGAIIKQAGASETKLTETQLHQLVLEHFLDNFADMTMVDNSKYTDGLDKRWLAPDLADKVDIRFIHVVRDYRGWATSKERTYATYKGYRGRKKPLLLHCLTWWYRNKVRARQLKSTGRPVLTLSYEALVFNLEQELRKIAAFSGLRILESQAHTNGMLSHDCHGNPIRRDSSLYSEMRYDNRWTYDPRFLWLAPALIPVHYYWKSLNVKEVSAGYPRYSGWALTRGNKRL